MSVRPTPGQLAWQRAAMGVFFHFGVNTFYDREWSDGTLDPAGFDPDDLDADQWVRVAKAAGAGYVVLTAKHHDGFCLWPTATIDYSVRSAPWRNGRGDVVAELAAACRRHDLKLGLYLSPWDRNASCYSDPAAYDAFYLAQLPTIRWVGNEDGLAADPVDYAVSQTQMSMYDRLQQWRPELDQRFAAPLAAIVVPDGDTIMIDFGAEVTLDHLELSERPVNGQQITAHTVTGPGGELATGQTIGIRRLHVFAPVTVQTLRVSLAGADGPLGADALESVGVVDPQAP